MKVYTERAILEHLDEFQDKIDNVKVTNVEVTDFNTMEGYSYLVNLKITYKTDRYKLVQMVLNSSYFDNEGETVEEYLENLLY